MSLVDKFIAQYILADWQKEIVREEGVVLKLYKCPAGYNTIGIGENLDANSISMNVVNVIFSERCQQLRDELRHRIDYYPAIPDPIYAVLMNMAFNMGVPRLMKFKKMLRALEVAVTARSIEARAGAYVIMAEELIDSSYARNRYTKGRAKRLADKILTYSKELED